MLLARASLPDNQNRSICIGYFFCQFNDFFYRKGSEKKVFLSVVVVSIFQEKTFLSVQGSVLNSQITVCKHVINRNCNLLGYII